MKSLAFASLICLSGALATQPLDVDVDALPFEPRERPLEGLVITVDAGHGGSSFSPGYSGSARGVNSGVVEGDLNMLVAGELLHLLRRGGADVALTRQDDRKVTLGDTGRAEELGARVRFAERRRSHLFLALHHNAVGRETADGVVVMIWPTDAAGQDQPLERAFADALREAVEAQVHHTERFDHYINLHPLVASSEIPSAVVEFGFLTNPEFDAWVSQPGSHVPEAIGVYNGVVRMWQEHRAELEALRDRLFPRRGGAEAGDPAPFRRVRPGLDRIAARLWPFEHPPQTAAEAEYLIEAYKRSTLSDTTFFLLDAHVEGNPSRGWRLTGRANHPDVLVAAGELLEAAGCRPLSNELRLVPGERVGERRHGIVQIPMALTFEEPGDRGVQMTQLLLGERVWLLDEIDDPPSLLVHAADGYIGWVRPDAVMRLTAEEITPWETARRARVIRDYLANDFRIPAGATLPIVALGEETATLRLPMGVRATEGREEVTVPLDHLRLPSDPPPGRVAAETAVRYLTVPYIFGGRSALGMDCSGLVGLAYQTAGLRLPRDARQQVLVGELVGTPWRLGPLQPGDILFFADQTGRITHTGLSLGGLRFVHESPPHVHVSSLDPDDPLYEASWASHFAFARRPLE